MAVDHGASVASACVGTTFSSHLLPEASRRCPVSSALEELAHNKQSSRV